MFSRTTISFRVKLFSLITSYYLDENEQFKGFPEMWDDVKWMEKHKSLIINILYREIQGKGKTSLLES